MLNVLEVTENPSAIGSLFQSATTVVTKIFELFGTVSNTLLNNPIFQITIGIIMLGIVMGLVFTLVRRLKRRG